MMKKNRKIALVLACAVLLVASTVYVTLAYLSATDSVTNTFTVGKVGIVLDEAKVDEYGEAENHDVRVTENQYKLVPGLTYVKDPTVTVKGGSELCYVRMMVTINKYEELKNIFGDDFLPQEYVEGWDEANWPCVNIKEDAENNTCTYEFLYKEAVPASDEDTVLDDLFEEFTFPGEVTEEQMADLEDMEIDVVAHAIQAAGFDGAEDAWEAFDSQNNQ